MKARCKRNARELINQIEFLCASHDLDPKDIQVGYRTNYDSDVEEVKFVFEDLFDEVTNNRLESIVLMNNDDETFGIPKVPILTWLPSQENDELFPLKNVIQIRDNGQGSWEQGYHKTDMQLTKDEIILANERVGYSEMDRHKADIISMRGS